MNFLLHRELALNETHSAEAGIGAMLPDLWRMADRGMRARRLDTVPPSAAPSASSLQTGVHHHLEADGWFHKTRVFKEGERWLAKQLVTVGAPKLVLFAHPAWEMCLDGALLLGKNFAHEMTQLQSDFDTARAGLDAVADLHGATKLGTRAQFDRRMHQLVEGIVEGRWMASYCTGDGLVQCVAGMRRRFALPSMEEQQESVTACIFEEALELAQERLPELLDDRKRIVADETAGGA